MDDTDNNNNSENGAGTSVNGHGSSSSSASDGYLLSGYDRCVLMAAGAMDRSKAHQKELLVLILKLGLKPISVTNEDGKKFYLLAHSNLIAQSIADYPAGVWMRPV